jgi:hypothetical protein
VGGERRSVERGHLGDVRPSRKGAVSSRDHYAPHRFIGIGVFQRASKLGHCLVPERIAGLGAYHGDQDNTGC